MSKYKSPAKQVEELIKVVALFAEKMEEFARWEAYRGIKDTPLQFNEKLRKEILEHSKGHITHILYQQLFRAYPLTPSSVIVSPKETGEK